MNSLSIHFNESIAPARRSVVAITISDAPVLPRITALPLGGEGCAAEHAISAAGPPQQSNDAMMMKLRCISDPFRRIFSTQRSIQKMPGGQTRSAGQQRNSEL